MENIYVKLLEEATEVYRPAPATKLAPSVYLIGCPSEYDPADEKWEFPPGSRVIAAPRVLSAEPVLVAIGLSP